MKTIPSIEGQASVRLSPSQEAGLKQFLETRDNIFLTGGPGTGKSFLISHYLKQIHEKIPVIASTGAAALLVGGRTFHSFFNLGIMQGGAEQIFRLAIKNGRLRKRLQEAHTLVIDEISMLSAETLECAEQIARAVRESPAPWGGIRIIAVGDFAQLPPISRSPRKEWCFFSGAWERSEFKMGMLREVKRSSDEVFLRMLEEIRWGNVSEDTELFLNSRKVEDEELEADVPHIFPRRAQTDAYNRMKLEELHHPRKIFKTEYGGDLKYREKIMRDAPVPPELELKKGAFIMLRVNDPKQRFINGTVGRVLEMDEESLFIDIGRRSFEIEKFTFTLLDGDGKEVAFARNFPVTLAYASTIHKIQGTTLERIHADLRSLWEPGQAYVALSRAKTSQGITLMGWDRHSIKADPLVRRFYEEHDKIEVPVPNESLVKT